MPLSTSGLYGAKPVPRFYKYAQGHRLIYGSTKIQTLIGEKFMLVPPFGATSYADKRKCKAIQEITLGFSQAEPDKTQMQVVYYEVNSRKFGKGKGK